MRFDSKGGYRPGSDECGYDNATQHKLAPCNNIQRGLVDSYFADHSGFEVMEGQPNWQAKSESGRMPAPPHDAFGHTWHHPDSILFGITKYGMLPGKYGPPGYQSDMPAFGSTLSDEQIWAVLAYIKSVWPEQILSAQANLTRGERQR